MPDRINYIPCHCEDTECPLYPRRVCIPTSVSRPVSTEDSVQEEELLAESEESYGVSLAIIGSPPTKSEAVARVPFVEDSNMLLKKLIKAGGPLPGGQSFLHIIRCPLPDDIEDPKDRERVKESAIEHCKKHLEKDILRLNPKVVVLAGPDAYKAVTGNPVLKQVPGKSPIGSYGHVAKHLIGGKKWTTVATLSSEVLYKQTPAISYTVACLDKARDLAENGSKSIYHPVKWTVSPEIHYCDTVESIENLVDTLLHKTNNKQVCAVDVETMNLNVAYGNKLVMLQFCVDPQDVWCVPFEYIYAPFGTDDYSRVKDALYRLFTERPGFRYWVGHGITFDILQIMSHITGGKTLTNRPLLDTQSMFYLLDENRVDLSAGYGLNLKLKTLSKECLGRDAYTEEALEEREAGFLYKMPPKELCDYAGNDVVNTLLLYRYCRLIAQAQDYLEKMMCLCVNFFSGAIRLISILRRNGMFIDLPYIRLLTSENSPIVARMRAIEKEFKSSTAAKKTNIVLAKQRNKNQKMIFGTPWIFDINKTDHRIELFFNQLKLKPISYGKSSNGDVGAPSMDDAFWEKYKGSCTEAALAQEYFGLKKLSTSYANSLLEYVDPQYGNIDCYTDSRIRPTFGITSTNSGRIASWAPNGQNLPKADSEAKAAIKSLISAQQSNGKSWKDGTPVEYVLLQNDFKASEVKIWCCISQDRILANVLNNGIALRTEYKSNPTPELKKRAKFEGDLHRSIAAIMFNKPVDQVTDHERQAAKTIVFGLMYGRGVKAIAEQLKNPNIEEVAEQCQKFMGAYPEGVAWFYRMEYQAVKKLQVESDLHRRRKLFAPLAYDPSLPREHHLRGAFAECKRQARNSPIQSESSDMAIIGSFLFLDYIEQNNKNWKIINFVHDSCVAEVPIGELEEAAKVMEDCFTTTLMEYVTKHWGMNFISPLEIECEVGVRWGEMRKLDGSEPDFKKAIEWLTRGGKVKWKGEDMEYL